MHLDQTERRAPLEREGKMESLEILVLPDPKEKEAPKVNRASKAKRENLERMEWMEHLESVARKALRALRGMLGHRVLLDVLARQVPPEAKEIEVTLARLEPEEIPEGTAKGDLPEHPAPPELPVNVDQGVPLAVLEHQASLEILASLVRAVLPVCLDLLARTEQMVPLGHLDLPDQWEMLENRALLEI